MTRAATMVIPTIGRPKLLARALESIAACSDLPAETLVVDQSGDDATAQVVEASGLPGARTVASPPRGRGFAVNLGLEQAAHDTVFVIDDDCTAEPNLISAGLRAMNEVPAGIACGQVLPAGPDPRMVPSCRVLEDPVDFTGEVDPGALYAGNMVCSRTALLEVGGFDARIVPAAEDCDLCYRWLRAGRVLRHVPQMVVHHHGWRPPEELRAHYVGYYRGQGMFYAKHLRGKDLRMLRFLANDGRKAIRGLASRVVLGTPSWSDPRRGIARGLLRGLRDGWRAYGKS